MIEARKRVGGRVLNMDIGGGEVSERGGTFTAPTQDFLMAMAKEMGVPMIEQYNKGENVYFADGERSTYSDTGPLGTAPPDPQIVADLATVVTCLNEMSREVPVDAPWQAASAAGYDSQTFQTWLEDNSASPRFRRIAATATRPIFGAEPLRQSGGEPGAVLRDRLAGRAVVAGRTHGERRAGLAHRPGADHPPAFGRLHWAGTETSTFWNGYMDGAIRSGKRVATEVLAEL